MDLPPIILPVTRAALPRRPPRLRVVKECSRGHGSCRVFAFKAGALLTGHEQQGLGNHCIVPAAEFLEAQGLGRHARIAGSGEVWQGADGRPSTITGLRRVAENAGGQRYG